MRNHGVTPLVLSDSLFPLCHAYIIYCFTHMQHLILVSSINQLAALYPWPRQWQSKYSKAHNLFGAS